MSKTPLILYHKLIVCVLLEEVIVHRYSFLTYVYICIPRTHENNIFTSWCRAHLITASTASAELLLQWKYELCRLDLVMYVSSRRVHTCLQWFWCIGTMLVLYVHPMNVVKSNNVLLSDKFNRNISYETHVHPYRPILGM